MPQRSAKSDTESATAQPEDQLYKNSQSSTPPTPTEAAAKEAAEPQQLDLFAALAPEPSEPKVDEAALEKEKQLQQAMLGIKSKFGKNALVKGMNLEEGATAMQRNKQIGGHKA